MMPISWQSAWTAIASADDDPPVMDRRPRQAFARGALTDVPPLTGLAQVVGLALGSPEFQRR